MLIDCPPKITWHIPPLLSVKEKHEGHEQKDEVPLTNLLPWAEARGLPLH
jgi:hypothetical protein